MDNNTSCHGSAIKGDLLCTFLWIFPSFLMGSLLVRHTECQIAHCEMVYVCLIQFGIQQSCTADTEFHVALRSK